MKTISLLLCVAILVFAGCVPAETANRLAALETELASVKADNADLVAQLDAADAEVSAKATAAKSTALDKQTVESQLRTAQQETVNAQKQVGELNQKLEEAQKEARDAKKAALAEAHKTCPPPETTAKADESDPPQKAPAVESKPRVVAWMYDMEPADMAARDLHRLQLIAFSTNSCPHCDIVFDLYESPKVAMQICTEFVPQWVMVRHRGTEQFELAERFGVNEFQYPAIVLRDPGSGTYRLFRPSEDEATLVRQLESERAALLLAR